MGQDYEKIKSHERRKANRKLFDYIVGEYRRIREMPPLSSRNLDFTAPRSNLTWTRIDFCADVERASRDALKGTQAIKRWSAYVADPDSITPGQAAGLSEQCANVYRSRGLQPHLYFRILKRGNIRPSVVDVIRDQGVFNAPLNQEDSWHVAI